MRPGKYATRVTSLVSACVMLALFSSPPARAASLLNVSYDPTREFYQAYNALFAKYWKSKTGEDVKVSQSHGGSEMQARSVIEGLDADVVTLAIAYDIDNIAQRAKLLPADWQKKLPHNSCPYHSIIVFLVRKGNPKHIRDWDDLVRDNVQVLTPNPKTSGGARWNYLAAWAYAYKKNNGNEESAEAFIRKLYDHAPVLDTGARAATINFTQRGIGDVLITWENEAMLITHDLDKGQFGIVTPSVSILAEPPVAVVEKNAIKDGNEKVARAYLQYLYSKEAQKLAAKSYYRPTDNGVAAHYVSLFPTTTLMHISDFGDWEKVQQVHFADGGIFDQIYGNK